jgi:rSAM/selenodomain-associated transferase 1
MAAVAESGAARARTLVVFARDPAAGGVKTRLAAAIGASGATALYAAFVKDLAQRFASAPFRVVWAVAPPDLGFAARFWLSPETCEVQVDGDLGARMRAAFAAHTKSPDARCVLIGSDAPQLERSLVERAFDRLDGADLVLAPADDGGYTLIAMREPHDVFCGVAWSTATVLVETLARARSLGLRVQLLEPGFDVDTESDLARLAKLAAGGFLRQSPHTEAELRRLGLI